MANFSPAEILAQAEIVLRLDDEFQPGLKFQPGAKFEIAREKRRILSLSMPKLTFSPG